MLINLDSVRDGSVRRNRMSIVTLLTCSLLFACVVVYSSGNLLAQRVLATVDVGNEPLSVAVNIGTNIVYVVNHEDNSVSVIDGSTNQLVINVAVSESPFQVKVNRNTNIVYALSANADTDSNGISVINGITNIVVDMIVLENQPGDIAVNSETNLIYVTDNIDHKVIVIDGSTNEIVDKIDIDLDETIFAVDINDESNKLYLLSVSRPVPEPDHPSFDNKVIVIDGSTGQVTDTFDVGLCRTTSVDIAVNPATNRIYVSNSFPLSSIEGIDGETNKIVDNISFGLDLLSPSVIAVNAVNNHMYVVCPDSDITVVDITAKQITGTVQISDSSISDIAVNPVTHTIYATDRISGSLIVVKDENQKLTTLSVSPDSARSSFRIRSAVVTAMDQSGLPIADVTVNAKTKGLGVIVSPGSVTTDSDGNAKFNFRFRYIGRDGKVMFNAADLSVVIDQK